MGFCLIFALANRPYYVGEIQNGDRRPQRRRNHSQQHPAPCDAQRKFHGDRDRRSDGLQPHDHCQIRRRTPVGRHDRRTGAGEPAHERPQGDPLRRQPRLLLLPGYRHENLRTEHRADQLHRRGRAHRAAHRFSKTRTTRWTNSATACSGSSTRWRASTRKRSRAQTSTSRAAWTAAPARAPASSTSRRPTTRRSRTF